MAVERETGMTVRVVQWGLGAMGSGMARLMLSKEGLEVVGAIDSWSELTGKDLGEVLGLGHDVGVRVTNDPADVLDPEKVDCVVIATTSWVARQFEDLVTIITSGINVVSIAEEMTAPAAQSPELAARLDELARQHEVSVLGTGVNPGFVLDLLVVVLSAGCHRVDRIEARRVNDLAPYGPTVLRTQGVGLSPEEFALGVADGTVVGHVGFPESIKLISDALGLGVDRVLETREPIIADSARSTAHIRIEQGMVAGCAHTAIGYRGDEEVITLVHPQKVWGEDVTRVTGDYIHLHGVPEVTMAIEPEYAGGIATQGIAVNSIPLVVAARPGLLSMTDIPVPAALMGPSAFQRAERTKGRA